MSWKDTSSRSLAGILCLSLAACTGSVLNPQVFPDPAVGMGVPHEGQTSADSACCTALGTDLAGCPNHDAVSRHCRILLEKQSVLSAQRVRADKLLQDYRAAVQQQSAVPATVAGVMPFGAGYVGWRAAARGTENSSPLLAALALMGSAYSFNSLTYSEPRIRSYLEGIRALACVRDTYGGIEISPTQARALAENAYALRQAVCRLRMEKGFVQQWLGTWGKSRCVDDKSKTGQTRCEAQDQTPAVDHGWGGDDACSNVRFVGREELAYMNELSSMSRVAKAHAGSTTSGDDESKRCTSGSLEVDAFCIGLLAKKKAVTALPRSAGRDLLRKSVIASGVLIDDAERELRSVAGLPLALGRDAASLGTAIDRIATDVNIQVATTMPKPETVQQSLESMKATLPSSVASQFTFQSGPSLQDSPDDFIRGPLAPAAERVRFALAAVREDMAGMQRTPSAPGTCNVGRPGAMLSVLPAERVRDIKAGTSFTFAVTSALDTPSAVLAGSGSLPREALTIVANGNSAIVTLAVPKDASGSFFIYFRDGAGSLTHEVQVRVVQ